MMTYDDLEEFIKKVVIYGNGRINKVVLDDECVFGALSKVTREEAICYGQSLVNSISINIPMLLNHYKNPNFDFKTDEDMKSHAAWIAIHELSHLDQKKDFNAKIEDLKSAIDKNNETILQDEGKIKTLSKNPNNKRSIEKLKLQNEELKSENDAKNAEMELLNAKMDLYSNVETSFNDWRQKAFDVLEKSHTGSISKENKVKLNSISEDFKNLEKLFNDTCVEPAVDTETKAEVKEEVKNDNAEDSKK